MAGPVASVLLAHALSEPQRAELLVSVLRLKPTGTGMGYHFRDRPFLVWFGEEYDGELGGHEISALAELVGWKPSDQVTFAAGCNSPLDHELRANLCLSAARLYGGIVDFGGTILDVLPAPKIPTALQSPANLQGTLYISHYLADSGTYFPTHYADATLLESWAKDPRFRMVK